MSDVKIEMASYFQHVRGRLSCSRRYQDEQMQKIFRAAEEYAQENPDATPEEVEMYLGDPAEVAQVLMEGLDPAEVERYHRRKKFGVLFIIGILTAALIAVSMGAVYYARMTSPIEITETLIIYEEVRNP